MLKIFNLFVVSNAFKLLTNYTPPNQLLLRPCSQINPVILETTYHVCTALRKTGVVDCEVSELGNVNVCSAPNGHYGTFYPNTKEIWLNDLLIHFKKLIFNIILHEIVHALGLDHSKEIGIMSYSVRQDSYGITLEDSTELWPSIDDFRGLLYIKYMNL